MSARNSIVTVETSASGMLWRRCDHSAMGAVRMRVVAVLIGFFIKLQGKKVWLILGGNVCGLLRRRVDRLNGERE